MNTKEKLASINLTLSEALKIVRPSPFNKHMIKALQLCPFLNTEEDWLRLKAAILVERNKSKIKYHGPKIGYQVN